MYILFEEHYFYTLYQEIIMNSKINKGLIIVGVGLTVAVGVGLAVFFSPAFAVSISTVMIGFGLTTLSVNVPALATTAAIVFGTFASMLTSTVMFVVNLDAPPPIPPRPKKSDNLCLSGETVFMHGQSPKTNNGPTLHERLDAILEATNCEDDVVLRSYFDQNVGVVRQLIVDITSDTSENIALSINKLNDRMLKYIEILNGYKKLSSDISMEQKQQNARDAGFAGNVLAFALYKRQVDRRVRTYEEFVENIQAALGSDVVPSF